MMNDFGLQCSEETLCDGIVATIAFTTHALFAAGCFEFLAERIACVKASLDPSAPPAVPV